MSKEVDGNNSYVTSGQVVERKNVDEHGLL